MAEEGDVDEDIYEMHTMIFINISFLVMLGTLSSDYSLTLRYGSEL